MFVVSARIVHLNPDTVCLSGREAQSVENVEKNRPSYIACMREVGRDEVKELSSTMDFHPNDPGLQSLCIVSVTRATRTGNVGLSLIHPIDYHRDPAILVGLSLLPHHVVDTTLILHVTVMDLPLEHPSIQVISSLSA